MIFSIITYKSTEQIFLYHQLVMGVKKILLFVLLFTASFSEIILPIGPSSEDSAPPKDPPCGKNLTSCGEAANFQNQIRLLQFSRMFAKRYVYFGEQTPVAGTFSGTTVQVQNVDEADLLKTDGEYIYTISNNVLSIIRAYPPEKAEVIFQRLLPYNASAMFLEGNNLAVFGTEKRQRRTFTNVDIFDVSDKKLPKILKNFFVSGRYFDGRKLQDGFIYLISTHSVGSMIPQFSEYRFKSVFWYPQIQYIDPLAVNILSFNLKDPINSKANPISVFSESKNVIYMSEQYIYLATNYTDQDGEISTKIRKIYVWGDYIQPFADGVVKGTVNNQFSLDQYGRFLRIATTTTNSAKADLVGVYTLDYRLEPYGKIYPVGIYQVVTSCRFVNRRLYLSTSNERYPFIIIGFSNHKNPQFMGRLKTSGYSTYIHPYDETTIIGLGRDVSSGQKLGMKLALFNVTIPTRPREIANLLIEERYASSIAEWEHKAFLFSVEKKLLVIPARMNFADNKFNGALVFTVTKNSIALGAMIDHLGPKDNFNERSVERSVWIENYLYTKSSCLLKINKINQRYDPVSSLNIPCK